MLPAEFTEVPVYDIAPEVREICVNQAAQYFAIHPLVIHAILDVEGGKVGLINRNENGTVDLGPMQLNSSNLKYIQDEFPTVTAQQLLTDPCINIGVGTWWLSERLKEVGAANLWKAVGNYHSKTPTFHNRYLQKIKVAYVRLLGRWKNNNGSYVKK